MCSKKAYLSLPFAFGLSLLVVAILPIIFTSALWFTGSAIQPWILPVSVIVALSIEYRLAKSVRLVTITFLFLLIALLIAGLAYDNAYDSNTYHKPIAFLLAEGWNPVCDQVAPTTSLWVKHYAKFLETYGATVFALTGVLEQGKIINLILAASLAAFSYDYLIKMGAGRRKAFLLTLVVLCNPVLTTQLFTFYVDYSIYVYTAISIILLCEIGISERRGMVLISLLIVTLLAIGTKFNAFFFQGLVMLCGLGWYLVRKKYDVSRQLLAVGFASLLIGLFIFYHPYVTNWLQCGHPLYPLMGEGAVDIMDSNTPDLYRNHNRVVNFFLSMASPSPGKGVFTSFDSRMSGFTILMLPLLLFSLFLAYMGRRTWPNAAYYIMSLAFLSCFIFEQSWWARYVPQLWVVPTVSSICYFLYSKRNRWCDRILVGLFSAVFILSGAAQSGVVLKNTMNMRKRQVDFHDRTLLIVEPSVTDRHILDKWGVKYEIVDSLPVEKQGDFGGHAPYSFK